MGSAGRTLLRYQRDEAWAALVSFLGLRADPTWADHILVDCQPVLISATTEEVLEWIGDGLRSGRLAFPDNDGLISWPRIVIATMLGQCATI
jgi:hypothetical protein